MSANRCRSLRSLISVSDNCAVFVVDDDDASLLASAAETAPCSRRRFACSILAAKSFCLLNLFRLFIAWSDEEEEVLVSTPPPRVRCEVDNGDDVKATAPGDDDAAIKVIATAAAADEYLIMMMVLWVLLFVLSITPTTLELSL